MRGYKYSEIPLVFLSGLGIVRVIQRRPLPCAIFPF
nr:MAG TPA: Protein of unknown function DUF2374 [Caudoviricetes sp.]